MFEAMLWDVLHRVPPDGYALAEGESRHIGRLALPLRVYQSLQVEVSVWVEAPMAARVKNILADYPARDDLREGFAGPLRALKERLGRQAVAELLALLAGGDWEVLVRELMIRYYDPLYRHTLPERRIEVMLDAETKNLCSLKEAIAGVLASRGRTRGETDEN
jgi:tRNA 2-selenouridine synthase